MRVCGSIPHFLPLFSFSAMKGGGSGVRCGGQAQDWRLWGSVSLLLQPSIQATFSDLLSIRKLFLWAPFGSLVCFISSWILNSRKERVVIYYPPQTATEGNRGCKKRIKFWNAKDLRNFPGQYFIKKKGTEFQKI